MSIFLAIAIASFLLVTGSFLFGHDHDMDHDHDHDHGHGEGGHALESDAGEPTISFFSVKVLATLLMGFGAAGAIARHYQANYLVSSLIGLVCGLLLGGLMYAVLGVFYRQQASSLVATSTAIGRTATVTVSISEGGTGEVGLNLNDQYVNYSASAKDGQPIARGQTVRVVKTVGSHVVVEKDI